ncbi:MAG: hypothetical protein LBE36_06505 [Flavobacteriaceae bacterium]|nr:hypothetical protein [Flavobacteriaceae bacterium]
MEKSQVEVFGNNHSEQLIELIKKENKKLDKPREPLHEDLLCYYTFSKLTPKIMKKQCLNVIYDNCKECEIRWINRSNHIVYVRKQTEKEKSDAVEQNRMYSIYRMFIDEKHNIESVLQQNFNADSNNVSLEEREKIREICRQKYFKIYNVPNRNIQLVFDF